MDNYVAKWRTDKASSLLIHKLNVLLDIIKNQRRAYPDEVLQTRNDKETFKPAVSVRFAIDALLYYHGWKSGASNGDGYTFWTRHNPDNPQNDEALVTMISYPTDPNSGNLGFAASILHKTKQFNSEPIIDIIQLSDILRVTEEHIEYMKSKLGEEAIKVLL